MKDLLVIYRDDADDGILKKGFNLQASKAQKKDWIVQKIAKHFLTEVGTNFYDPSYGIFSATMAGDSFTEESLALFKTSVAQAVNKIETSIAQEQMLQPDLQSSDRVSTIFLQSVKYDKILAKIEILLKITMANNNTFQMRV